MNHTKRPTTEADLAEWQRVETLAIVELTPDGMRCGLLASVDNMLMRFLSAETAEQPVDVKVEGSSIIVSRPRPVAELAARLLAEQERWDHKHGQPDPTGSDLGGVSVAEIEATWPAPAESPMPGDTHAYRQRTGQDPPA